jgi:hypothetical protein
MQQNGASLASIAQGYAKSGLSFIPIQAGGNKRPDASVLPRIPGPDGKPRPSWEPFKERQPSQQEIGRWYGNGVQRGIALVCGKISGSLEVLDFDRPGIYEQWRDVVVAAGAGDLEQRLPLEATPKGGRHVLYRCAQVEGNRKLASANAGTDDRPDVRALIETRGEGGYIVVSPTPAACHELNKPYVLLRGRLDAIPTITAAERQMLHEAARTLNEYVAPERTHVFTTSLNPASGTRPGDDFNRKASWAEVLEPHGWRLVFARGQVGYWKRPGKQDQGWSATTNYADSDLLYIFSSSAHPFENEHSYDKFGAFARLNHHGNLADAGKALAAKGYGDQSVRSAQTTMNGATPHTANGVNSLYSLYSHHPQDKKEKAQWPQMLAHAALIGLAGEVVNHIYPHTEADKAALLISFLTSFGSVIGRGAYTKVGATMHHLNEFAVLVGKTGMGRKGTSWDPIEELFRRIDPEWTDKRIISGLASGEGIIHAVRDPLEKKEQVREKGRPTGKFDMVLVDEGVEDKRLMVVESEFASILKVMAREGNTLSTTIRNAWDGKILNIATRNNPERATGAHISIIGHVTPKELLRYLNDSEASNGFGNRFMWVCTRRSKVLPHGGEIPNYGDLTRKLHDAVRTARNLGHLRRNEDAEEEWESLYADLIDVNEERGEGLYASIVARAAAHVLRLSGIYAALDGSATITLRHLNAAMAVWDYIDASCKYVFESGSGDEVADRVLAFMETIPGGVTKGTLFKLFGNHVSATRLQASLEELQAQELVYVEKQETGGRPTEIWKLVVSDANKANKANKG